MRVELDRPHASRGLPAESGLHTNALARLSQAGDVGIARIFRKIRAHQAQQSCIDFQATGEAPARHSGAPHPLQRISDKYANQCQRQAIPRERVFQMAIEQIYVAKLRLGTLGATGGRFGLYEKWSDA